MQIKKYALSLAFLCTLAGATFAQKSTDVYDVYDSAVITKKGMPQQNEFWNNTYKFPSKPRNMWEVGVSGGLFNVSGDVPSQLGTFGFAAHARKAIGHVFSLRLQYLYGTSKGLNWKAAGNFANNDALRDIYSAPIRQSNGSLTTTIPGQAKQVVYYNYKTKAQDLSIQGLINLNNINFYNEKSNWSVYVGGGIGFSAYETRINARNEANGTTYAALYDDIFRNTQAKYQNKKDIRSRLKAGMDDTYETAAESYGDRKPTLGKQTVNLSTTIIAGVSYRLSKRINISLEDRHTLIKDDLMDGQQWQEHPIGDGVLTPGWDSYNYLSVGVNFNLGSKSIQPLWWINPLDYVYSELNKPRHQQIPKPVYEDADADGVIDQLDREPNTAAGASVDTHGVTRDSDGDGVPDSQDKQLITPTECQPVDADGVGKCPEPECCKNMTAIKPVECPSDYPSLSFKAKTTGVGADMKAMLMNVANKLKANPTCNIMINGYPEASKAAQAVCQKRLDAVKMYLVQKEGISAERISTNCEVGGGDKDTVDIKSN
jgi:outer membrane protein OmpA-like peptidoglycan-associated protein/opacity protein-like surface antigen